MGETIEVVTETRWRRLRHWFVGLWRPRLRAMTPVEADLRAHAERLATELAAEVERSRSLQRDIDVLNSQALTHRAEMEIYVAMHERALAAIRADQAVLAAHHNSVFRGGS